VTPPTTLVAPVRSGAETEDVSRAQRGDLRAFERLYRAHASRVSGLVRRMMDAEHAPDVTQDIFVRVWQKLGTFRGESAFGTWLHRVAVNVILQRRASLRTERERFVGNEEAIESAPGRFRADSADPDLERAIARLPQGARAVFVLHDVEGFTHEEIGGFLGVTAGTSKAQLHRARMILRDYLKR
jgi:RNA polymerase sigma-70 factor (ECF subfamily)